MNAIDKIKKAMGNEKLIIGERATLRQLRKNQTNIVIVANNTPSIKIKELKSLCNINKIDFEIIEKDNVELGVTCRKPFGVSVLSIKK